MPEKDESLPIRLFVRFADPAAEERFLAFYSAHYFRFIQFSLILGIALLVGDFAVDKLSYPDIAANWLRLTVCIPILATGLAYTFVGSARRFWEPAMSVLIVTIAIALFITLHLIDIQGWMGLRSWVGILNFIFLEFYCFLILGIRFRYALIAGIAILAAFIVTIGYDDVQGYRQAYWSYHLLTLFLLAAGIGWWREFFLRKEFATRESLKTANENLTETALQHARARSLIEATLEATDNGILVIDQQGKISSYNSRFLEMWRIPEALVAGADDRQLLEFVVGQLNEPQKFVAHIEALYKQPAATSRHTLHFTDGRIFARFSHPQCLDGQIVGRVWSFLDITEQYATEQRVLHLSEVLTKELEQSEQQRGQLQALLSAIPDLIWMKDADGVYRSCNPTFGLLAGAPVEEIIGKTDRDFFPAEAAAMFRVDDLAAAADRTPLVREERVTFNSDGHPALLETIKTAVRGKDGKLIGVLGIARDVTKARAVLAELEQARAIALNSNEAKSRFLANMSHEIRTPMNAIIGMAELCLSTELSARQRNYVAKIQTASNALLHVINDILDFSKIEAGKMQIELIPFALEEVFEQLAAVLSLRAEEQGIELSFELDDRIPAQIIGDPLRLGQVLTNLVSNALKFSPGGNVRVQVEQVSETAKAVEFRFAIHDQGIGMTEEQLAELFKPFKQADASTTRRFGGTGLGLAISNHLVGLMGGRIWAESEANVGSSFYFTLWFTRSATSGRSGIAELASRLGEHADRPVLVVDDNAIARSIIAKNIEHLGFRTQAAASAEEALACVAENPNQQYLCCFVDWQMKELDGLETIKLLKHYFAQQPFAAPLMILVTAYSHHDDLKNIGDRIDGLLAKPITARHLYVELARCLGVFDPALASDQPKPGKSLEWSRFRGIDVLLVEDLEINQEVIVDLLANVEIYARLAANGAEALAEVARKVPDLILMDCQMPVMDGFTATRQIRANPLWKNIPVIALTANALTDDRKRCQEAGMNSHVAKPLRMEALFAAIANALPNHFSASSRLPEAVRASGEMKASDIPPIKGIDTAQGLIHVSGNTQLYRKLLRRFRESSLADFAPQFSAAIDAGDCATASRLAHSLKGVARTLGANDLGDAASSLEATCSQYDGIACRVLLESIGLAIEQLIKAIDNALAAS